MYDIFLWTHTHTTIIASKATTAVEWLKPSFWANPRAFNNKGSTKQKHFYLLWWCKAFFKVLSSVNVWAICKSVACSLLSALFWAFFCSLAIFISVLFCRLHDDSLSLFEGLLTLNCHRKSNDFVRSNFGHSLGLLIFFTFSKNSITNFMDERNERTAADE